MHIPDMGAPGIYEFIKWYYGQLDKEGLVVDVRANGGGNVSRMIIERLARQWLALGYSRTDSRATTYPDGVFIGPKIALLDEFAGSDGDIFPAMFKQAGLGTLVGLRSWGGVVGIAGRGPLIDGGSISVPEFGFANTKGEWIIEGHGVDPDIAGRERSQGRDRGEGPAARAGRGRADEEDPGPAGEAAAAAPPPRSKSRKGRKAFSPHI